MLRNMLGGVEGGLLFANMVEATQHVVWGGGAMLTFLELRNVP